MVKIDLLQAEPGVNNLLTKDIEGQAYMLISIQFYFYSFSLGAYKSMSQVGPLMTLQNFLICRGWSKWSVGVASIRLSSSQTGHAPPGNRG